MTSPAPYPKPRRVRSRLALSGEMILAGLMVASLTSRLRHRQPSEQQRHTRAATSGRPRRDCCRRGSRRHPGDREKNRTVRIASGLGNVDEQTPMRPGDRFRIASHTKTYVATVVLQLVSEGKLRLDDTVEQWLPGLVPNGDEITIRQLLNMTQRLFDYEQDPRVFAPYINGDLGYHWAPLELVQVAVSHEPLFEPGAMQSYSNTGYILAGDYIIERPPGTRFVKS